MENYCRFVKEIMYLHKALDCKTVRIFAYSSTREQSNKSLNEAENTELDYGRVRLARLRLLHHA